MISTLQRKVGIIRSKWLKRAMRRWPASCTNRVAKGQEQCWCGKCGSNRIVSLFPLLRMGRQREFFCLDPLPVARLAFAIYKLLADLVSNASSTGQTVPFHILCGCADMRYWVPEKSMAYQH